MALLDKYVFTLITPGATPDVNLTPINDRLIRDDEKIGGFAWGKRKVLKTKLRFAKTDYQFFKDAYEGDELFTYDLKIYQKCGGFSATPELWHTGKLLASKASWDKAAGIVEFEVVNDDLWECFLQGMKKKIDVLSYGDPIYVRNIHGIIEQRECTFSGPSAPDPGEEDDCIPGGADAGYWIKVYESINVNTGVGSVNVVIRWQRERWNGLGAPPDNSWHSVTDPIDGPIYVRKVKVNGPRRIEINGSTHYEFVWDVLNFTEQEGIDNGRLVKDIFVDIINESGCDFDGVSSTFFDVNPLDGGDATVYNRADAKLKYLTIFQRSDIFKWNAAENAQYLEMTIEGFLEILCKTFHCFWTIEQADGLYTFRLENASYFLSSNGLDLTTGSYAKYVRAYERFEMNTKEVIPAYERWSMVKYRPDSIFAPSEIRYATYYTSNDVKEYPIAEVTTDFAAMFLNDVGDEVDLSGSFLMACHLDTGGYYIDREYDEFNGALSFWELLRYYHTWDRYSGGGTVLSGGNSQVVTFGSVKRLKQAPEIEFSISCTDIALYFNANQLQKTALGWGEIESSSYDTLKESLRLKLLHS